MRFRKTVIWMNHVGCFREELSESSLMNRSGEPILVLNKENLINQMNQTKSVVESVETYRIAF